MPEVISRADAREQGLKRYFTGEPCKHGHVDARFVYNKRCAECNRVAQAALRSSSSFRKNQALYQAARRQRLGRTTAMIESEARYRNKNRERRNIANREYERRRRIEQHEVIVAWRKHWNANNKHRLKEYADKYKARNPETYAARHRAHAKARDKRVRQATPAWADRRSIVEFYKNCPEGHQVDHIIPLKGKIVSGLHVLENLQYLTVAENSKKWNHYTPDWMTTSQQ